MGRVGRAGDVNVVYCPQVGILSACVVSAEHDSDVAMALGQPGEPTACKRVRYVHIGIAAHGIVESTNFDKAVVGCRVRREHVVASRCADGTLKAHLQSACRSWLPKVDLDPLLGTLRRACARLAPPHQPVVVADYVVGSRWHGDAARSHLGNGPRHIARSLEADALELVRIHLKVEGAIPWMVRRSRRRGRGRWPNGWAGRRWRGTWWLGRKRRRRSCRWWLGWRRVW